ncbi:MAG: DNA repair exonuclease [Lachnospiraceae bacterium]|nr:DNA repair exonuclease [Lachnospiraceae bacterium]
MKFIHIADTHLGFVPDAGQTWNRRSEKDLWDSLSEVFQVAENEKIDIILIAGDLFHRQPLMRELKEFNYLCSKLTHTLVVFIAGNHDYMHPKSNYRRFAFAKNVRFLSANELSMVELKEYNACIYGFSYWQKELKEPRYDGIKPKDPGKINILIGHGGDAKHIPFRETTFRGSGFDYVALGHIHKGGQIIRNRVVMAGALEPTDCNDTGPHGYWMGEVTKRGCEVSFFPIRKCEYVLRPIPVHENMTSIQILEQIKNDLKTRKAYQYYKIILEGTYDSELNLKAEQILELSGIAAVENRLLPSYDFKRLKAEYRNTLLEKYINRIEKLPQNMVTKQAMYYGVDALYQTKEDTR